MTTCLDTITCPSDKRIYNIPCRFSFGLNVYVCNGKTTCMNTTGKQDCCAYNIADCLVLESSLRLPTVQPTLAISENKCDSQRCSLKYDTDTCYWYESVNSDILCSKDNQAYCCSQHREDCCKSSKTAAICAFSSIACVIVIFAFYRYVLCSYRKIVPTKIGDEVESHDKYKVQNVSFVPAVAI